MFNFFKKETVDAVGNVVEKTGTAFDKLFTSEEERNAAKIVFAKIKSKPAEWAHELNIINANSTSWFNSGWRPALGWVGALSALLYYVPQYVVGAYVWLSLALKTAAGDELPAYPVSDDGLWQLIGLLLGGATIRSFEKIKGVAKN